MTGHRALTWAADTAGEIELGDIGGGADLAATSAQQLTPRAAAAAASGSAGPPAAAAGRQAAVGAGDEFVRSAQLGIYVDRRALTFAQYLATDLAWIMT